MGKYILVIDDEEAVRKSFKMALEDTGYQIDTAESGEIGVNKVFSFDYDLIFLDLNMPGMNGIEALRQIRRINTKVPIYIFTAFHQDFLNELKIAQEEMLNFEVLKKPIGTDLIVKLIKLILGHPEKTKEASYV
jgi:CheY-like chemotaxis protein